MVDGDADELLAKSWARCINETKRKKKEGARAHTHSNPILSTIDSRLLIEL